MNRNEFRSVTPRETASPPAQTPDAAPQGAVAPSQPDAPLPVPAAGAPSPEETPWWHGGRIDPVPHRNDEANVILLSHPKCPCPVCGELAMLKACHITDHARCIDCHSRMECRCGFGFFNRLRVYETHVSVKTNHGWSTYTRRGGLLRRLLRWLLGL